MQNKDVKRFEQVLQSSKFKDKDEFSAASINVLATDFKYRKNRSIVVIAIALGLIIGVFYVLISNAFQSKRVSKQKTN